MSVRQIHIFISHSWKYSTVYDTLAKWIFEENWSVGQASLDFRNFSVPKDDRIHDAPTGKLLQEAIYNQVARSHVVVIPTGMYTHYSEWIGKEINAAKYYGKQILAVNPRGQERISGVVLNNSNAHVGWSKQSVISAIWKLYKATL